MTEWERIAERYECLQPWINIGLHWATKYYIRMDDTEAYVVAMCKFVNRSSIYYSSNLPTYTYSPQSCHSLLVDRKSVGIPICQAFKGDHFESCKYSVQLIVTFLISSTSCQMHQYRSQKPSTATATLSPSRVKPPIHVYPMRFAIENSVYERKKSSRESSVESEFRKYALADVSDEKTDILRFWEVWFQ